MPIINSDDPEIVEYAYKVWLSRRFRDTDPSGIMSNHSWYPTPKECRGCCAAVPEPTSVFRHSLLRHCRSKLHVAELFGITESSLSSRIERNKPSARRREGENYYKAVALVESRYLSIFDGRTEYNLDQQVEDRVRQWYGGGIYVYLSLEDAQAAHLPKCSALIDAPRVILRVRAEGKWCSYDNGNLAFSCVTPLEVVRDVPSEEAL